jgi:DNA mismatch repair protein MSH2
MQEDTLGRFIAMVETAIDLDQIDNGDYMVSPSYETELASLKNQLEEIEEHITKLHKQTANDLDLPIDKALKLEKGTQYGHVFRITKKEEQKVRKKLSGQYIVLETRKDGVKFTNSKLKKLGDHYQKLLSEYMSCQKNVVARVVSTSATFSEVSSCFLIAYFWSLSID